MIIDECQEKMNCLYSLVNVSSVITDLSLSIFIAGGGGGRSFGGNTWFSGGTEGYQVYLFNLQHPPPPPPPPPPPRARNKTMVVPL